jgi:hypothetical protein
MPICQCCYLPRVVSFPTHVTLSFRFVHSSHTWKYRKKIISNVWFEANFKHLFKNFQAKIILFSMQCNCLLRATGPRYITSNGIMVDCKGCWKSRDIFKGTSVERLLWPVFPHGSKCCALNGVDKKYTAAFEGSPASSITIRLIKMDNIKIRNNEEMLGYLRLNLVCGVWGTPAE